MRTSCLGALILASSVTAIETPDPQCLLDKTGSTSFMRGLLKGTQADDTNESSTCMTAFDSFLEGKTVIDTELGNPNIGKLIQTYLSVGGQIAELYNDCYLDPAVMSISKMVSSLSGALDGVINTVIESAYSSDVDTTSIYGLIECACDTNDYSTADEACGVYAGGVLQLALNYQVPEATLTYDITGTVIEKYFN